MTPSRSNIWRRWSASVRSKRCCWNISTSSYGSSCSTAPKRRRPRAKAALNSSDFPVTSAATVVAKSTWPKLIGLRPLGARSRSPGFSVWRWVCSDDDDCGEFAVDGGDQGEDQRCFGSENDDQGV